MGHAPGEPADSDTLHTYADQRDGIACGIDAVVSVREGLDDLAEPTGKQTITDEGQEAGGLSQMCMSGSMREPSLRVAKTVDRPHGDIVQPLLAPLPTCFCRESTGINSTFAISTAVGSIA